MTNFGFSLICEEHHPTELVANAQRADVARFDLLTSRTFPPLARVAFAQPLCPERSRSAGGGHQLG